MNIAILAGGDSSEFQISAKSGEEIQHWLEKAGYNAYLVTVRKNDWNVKNNGKKVPVDMNTFGFSNGKTFTRFDYAWNIIHGTPGENGRIQGYLDMLNIPYNCSGLLSSALTFNKFVAKNYLKQFGILTAEANLLKRNTPFELEEILEQVGLPCFVKPNNGGSSFGTTKVTQAEKIKPAIDAAFAEDAEVIVESYIKGTEVTCGLLKTSNEELIFPLTEIVAKNEFFDFAAKYEGRADEITPARIDEDTTRKCQQLASRIYDLTGSRGIVRVDFIIRGNQLYFLELNSIPGMTKESIVPQQVAAMGLTMETILQKVIEDSISMD